MHEDLGVDPLTEFASTGDHNLMIFGSTESRKHVRKLANSFGVDFEPYVSATYCLTTFLLRATP